MELLNVSAYLLIAILLLIYLLLRHRFSYWASRGVVHDKPHLFFGNLREVGRSKSRHQVFREFYTKYKHQAPFGGFYLSLRKAAVVLDHNLMKSMLIKDFSSFADRGNYFNERDDPLTGHLFNLDGTKWRRMRNKLTPTFSSGKNKFMLPNVERVAQVLIEVLRKKVRGDGPSSHSTYIEIKDLVERYITDVIGSCAFGLECNSLKDPQAYFRLMGKKAFNERRYKGLIYACIHTFPELARWLRVRVIPYDVHDFFIQMVQETLEYRERTKVQRNDFMNLLLELKKNNELGGLTVGEITAQAVVFFAAGLESSSSTMGFCLYELAVNTAIQDRARAEVNTVLAQHNKIFTYEAMHEMKYMQQILKETLRLYSTAPILTRKAVNDYPVLNSKHIIEKDTIVVFPVDAIHHDPDIYPNPDVFNPDNFAPAEVEKRSSLSWLPFGEGPRNCIGMRFAEMQMLVGLALLLKHFRFSLAPYMPVPIKIDIKDSFTLASEGGIFLRVEPI